MKVRGIGDSLTTCGCVVPPYSGDVRMCAVHDNAFVLYLFAARVAGAPDAPAWLREMARETLQGITREQRRDHEPADVLSFPKGAA